MPLSFRSAGVKDVTVFLVDSDPNTLAPPPARIVEIADRSENRAIAKDVRAYIGITVATGTPVYDLTPWVLDEPSGNWTKLASQSSLGDKDFF